MPNPHLISELERFSLVAAQTYPQLNLTDLKNHLSKIPALFTNPNTAQFDRGLSLLPQLKTTHLNLDQDCPQIGQATELTTAQKQNLFKALTILMPWRKGPIELFGTKIDSEWQSFLKWNRLKKALPDLKNKKVLDIGCNNGYYLFRLLSAKPSMLLGVDPFQLYFYQFYAIYQYIHAPNLFYLPIGMEQLTGFNQFFDCIFCMGILYHRRSPLDSLKQIHDMLQPKGTLILETLTYPGQDLISFCPQSTYAKMPNVYFIPTVSCLENWLKQSGFKHSQVISTDTTTITEQRKTNWMVYESLAEFLDKNDPTKTTEGHPTPQRSIIVAQK